MIGVNLFSGAGGLSLGATEAGVRVVLAVEKDKWAAATYSRNFPQTRVLVGDVSALRDIPVRKDGTPTILFGGPPCQGFSTSNQRTRGLSNPANMLYKVFLRLVSQWKPDWVVFENVRGILETAGGAVAEDIQKTLRRIGYGVHAELLNSVEFGVPQERVRLFVVGRREREAHLRLARTRKPVTVGEAIADLPALENGSMHDWLAYPSEWTSPYARELRTSIGGCGGHYVTRSSDLVVARYRHVPQGGNWEDIPAQLMANYHDRSRCHTGIYRRLRSDAAACVIGNFRKNMLIHPTQARGLSVREAARLQSFPDSFEFCGSIGFQQQQVGNAVPPALAEAVFRTICAEAGGGACKVA